MLAVATAVLLVIITAFRLLRWLVRALTARLTPRMRPRVARTLAVAVVFVLVAALANGLLWRALVNASSDAFGAPDRPVSEAAVSRPLAQQRSGSPALTDLVGLAGPSRQELRRQRTEHRAAVGVLRGSSPAAGAGLRRAQLGP